MSLLVLLGINLMDFQQNAISTDKVDRMINENMKFSMKSSNEIRISF